MPTLTKKVFLSSTLVDLKDYRAAAIHACQRAGLHPIYMEDFPPDPRDAVAFCMAKVEEADLFLGVYAHRYGYVPDGANVSITEMEYDRAMERGLPVHLFVMDPDFPWPTSKVDKGKDYERLEVFKAKIGKRHVWKKFGGVAEFKEDLLVHLLKSEFQTLIPAPEKNEIPKRALPPQPEMYSVPRYILTNRFIGRRKELDELDAWARSADPLLVVEGIGGVGKSALTWEWATERARQAIPGLTWIFWWSFYEGGAPTDSFVREALAYVTSKDPEALRSEQKGDLEQWLLAELRSSPFLFVLDGVERLLTAYHHYDPSKLQDDQVQSDLRACTNSQSEELLRQLAACTPSKILVTTRLMPSALENKAGQPIQGVQHKELHGLTPEDGERLLRDLGVRGESAAIRRFLQQFDNHGLLIGVLAGRIRDYRPAPGHFDRWLSDPKAGGGLRLSELDLKQRRTHILDYAFEGLEPQRKQLLSRIAVLSDAADFAMVAALNPYLPPESLRDSPEYRAAVSALDAALKDLENRGLLQWDRTRNTYDLHPVIRSHAFDQLEAQDRVQAFERVRDHFERLPPENTEEATELSEIRNAIQIYRALVGAGQFDRGAEFYRLHLATALLSSIAAYSTVVELLAPLFRDGFEYPPELADKREQKYLLAHAGVALAELGREAEAFQAKSAQMRLALEQKDWPFFVNALHGYSKFLEGRNKLAASFQVGEILGELALEAGSVEAVTRRLFDIMVNWVVRGQWAEAEVAYQKFTARPTPARPYYRIGTAEVWLCWLRFQQGTLRQKDLEEALAVAAQAKNAFGQRMLHEVWAEFALQENDPANSAQAAERALAIARKGGAPALYAQGCLARALAMQGRYSEAQRLIEETQVPLIDAAEIYSQLGDKEKAKEFGLRAYKWAWADGPPHIHWWELERSKRLLAQLGVPEPKLPPFDPSKVEPIPFEAEIRAAIEKLKGEKEEPS